MNMELSRRRSKRVASREETQRQKKQRRDAGGLLSDDILFHIFGYFLSEEGHVDALSIQAASATCRQWYEVANSKPLWSGLVCMPLDFFESEDCHVDAGSLIGLRKIEETTSSLEKFQNDRLFRVEERATGRKCLLAVNTFPRGHPQRFPAPVLRETMFANRALAGEYLFLEDVDHGAFPLQIAESQNSSVVLRIYDEEAHITSISRKVPDGQDLNSSELNAQVSIAAMRALECDAFTYNVDAEMLPPLDRAILVDWMWEIVQSFDKKIDTLYHAMGIFDQATGWSFSILQIPIQVLGAACFLLASKCNNDELTPRNLSFAADRAFSDEQILLCECIALGATRWKLGSLPIKGFVDLYCDTLSLDRSTLEYNLMCFVAENALLSPLHRTYKASIIAASVFVVARFCLQLEDLWSSELEQETGLLFEDLLDCINRLGVFFREEQAEMTRELIIFKYRYKEEARVVERAASSITSQDVLAYHQR